MGFTPSSKSAGITVGILSSLVRSFESLTFSFSKSSSQPFLTWLRFFWFIMKAKEKMTATHTNAIKIMSISIFFMSKVVFIYLFIYLFIYWALEMSAMQPVRRLVCLWLYWQHRRIYSDFSRLPCVLGKPNFQFFKTTCSFSIFAFKISGLSSFDWWKTAEIMIMSQILVNGFPRVTKENERSRYH